MQAIGTIVPYMFGNAPVGQVSRSQSEVFSLLYSTFLILGTIVGVVVLSYLLYNVYKASSNEEVPSGEYDVEENVNDDDVPRPERGVIPTGQGKGGGKKLFLSFGLSAVLVLGLIIFSYTLLLEVENAPEEADWEVEVEGYQFGWDYRYPAEDGLNTTDQEYENPDPTQYDYLDAEELEGAALVMPADRVTGFTVTSRDVWHNFGIPEMRAKSDAIPEQETETWALPEDPGVYEANCYELCGQGHSNMKGPVVVLTPEDFAEWYIQFDSVSEADLEFLGLSEDQQAQIVADHKSATQEGDTE